MTGEIDLIIEAIKDLPLKAALLYLISKGIKDFSKKEYEKIKQLICNKQNEGKYAFVPNKEEANQLLKLYQHPEYTEVRLLVPDYRYLDIIRTGLLMRSYHENDSTKNRSRVMEIKRDLGRRPNGSYFLKLANLPTTPHFSQILRYLHQLKLDGYSNNQLKDKFSEIVENWRSSSKFIKTMNKAKDIEDFCRGQIGSAKEEFFILGMRTVATMVEKTIEKLNGKGLFSENGYEYHIVKFTLGNQPRIEVTVVRKYDNSK